MRQRTEIEDTAQISTRATPTDEEIIRLQITCCATPQAPLKLRYCINQNETGKKNKKAKKNKCTKVKGKEYELVFSMCLRYISLYQSYKSHSKMDKILWKMKRQGAKTLGHGLIQDCKIGQSDFSSAPSKGKTNFVLLS